jgi:hypothetical protein
MFTFHPKKNKTGVLSEEWESPIGPWNPKGNSMKFDEICTLFLDVFFTHPNPSVSIVPIGKQL